MTYDGFVDELAERIDALGPRPKAAVFWLLGSGLLLSLTPPKDWAEWFESAHGAAHRFITAGEVDAQCASLWAQAGRFTGPNPSQLLNSTIICMSTPLGIATGATVGPGAWAEHALFPVMEHVSLEMFEDVSFPGEDTEVDEVYADPRVQSAVDFCSGIVSNLDRIREPAPSELTRLLEGAEVLAP